MPVHGLIIMADPFTLVNLVATSVPTKNPARDFSLHFAARSTNRNSAGQCGIGARTFVTGTKIKINRHLEFAEHYLIQSDRSGVSLERRKLSFLKRRRSAETPLRLGFRTHEFPIGAVDFCG